MRCACLHSCLLAGPMRRRHQQRQRCYAPSQVKIVRVHESVIFVQAFTYVYARRASTYSHKYNQRRRRLRRLQRLQRRQATECARQTRTSSRLPSIVMQANRMLPNALCRLHVPALDHRPSRCVCVSAPVSTNIDTYIIAQYCEFVCTLLHIFRLWVIVDSGRRNAY